MLISAGLIGLAVSVIHGVLTQRLMVQPVSEMMATDGTIPLSLRRLVPLLLQFSTFNWLISGLALIVAALWLGPEARLVVGVLAGSSYLFGAAGNCWGTRGRHPGWLLLAAASILIICGLA
ncbi:hypothetical protein [Altererythrobacter sp. ZODW24]|uniref:hypothetical protein n=1 Tax=Altererythrobacter sp. ZODW24 TaxID=2185142 RepID=UPI00196456AB|nr:hypothetical protein [Altererythrobacter sp. ZODW24]